jgi:hypothetical protein
MWIGLSPNLVHNRFFNSLEDRQCFPSSTKRKLLTLSMDVSIPCFGKEFSRYVVMPSQPYLPQCNFL